MNRRLFWLLPVTAVLLLLVIATYQISRTGDLARRAVAQNEKSIDVATVVLQVRNLNRLETASMRVMHVTKIEQTYGMIPNALAGDQLTFLAVGDVIAGVDMAKFTESDLRVEGKNAVFRLPPPELLVSRIDNDQSKVIQRDTGMLRRSDHGLESRARSAAKRGIREEAVKRGILTLAQKNAENQLAGLLKSLGFEQVRFEQSARSTSPVDVRQQ